MRHWILVFMIALLPLRGWVADAMATDMASTHALLTQTSTQTDAGHGHVEDVDGHGDHAVAEAVPVPDHADCVGHGAAAGEEAEAGAGHCESCTVCQA